MPRKEGKKVCFKGVRRRTRTPRRNKGSVRWHSSAVRRARSREIRREWGNVNGGRRRGKKGRWDGIGIDRYLGRMQGR